MKPVEPGGARRSPEEKIEERERKEKREGEREAASVPLVPSRPNNDAVGEEGGKEGREGGEEGGEGEKEGREGGEEGGEGGEERSKYDDKKNKELIELTLGRLMYDKSELLKDPEKKPKDFSNIENLKQVTTKINNLSIKDIKDNDKYQDLLTDLITIIEETDKSFLEDNPVIQNRKIEIDVLIDLIKRTYPKLQQINKDDYDKYIENEKLILETKKSIEDEKNPNQKLNDLLETVKNNTYGDPIIPTGLMIFATFTSVFDLLDGQNDGLDNMSNFFKNLGDAKWIGDSIDGIGDGIAGFLEVANLPLIWIGNLFEGITYVFEPTGIGVFALLKIGLFLAPKLMSAMNGDGFNPPTPSDLLKNYVNELENINETTVNENKYFASMLVTLSYLPNLTKEKINVNDLEDYNNNINKIFKLLRSKNQEEIIDLILDYYVISMTTIKPSIGDITMQKNKILKNTALFYFILSKDPNMTFQTVFDNYKKKIINKFDDFILNLTITSFSLLSGVTNTSNKKIILKYVEINQSDKNDDQKVKEILNIMMNVIEKNLEYGTSKVIGLFKFYFTNNKKEVRDKIINGFFNQFHKNIISEHLIQNIKFKFIKKIIPILNKQNKKDEEEKQAFESSDFITNIYSLETSIITKINKNPLKIDLEKDDKELLTKIDEYFELIFKQFISFHDNKNNNNNSVQLGWNSYTSTDESFIESIREFKRFLNYENFDNNIITSLNKILYFNPSIKITKNLFREKLLKYLVLFIYKLNLSIYNNENNIYYRIPLIFKSKSSNQNLNIEFIQTVIDKYNTSDQNKKVVEDDFIFIAFNKIDEEVIKINESIMLNLESSVIGFNKLIDFITEINEKTLNGAGDKNEIYLMFPKEELQNYIINKSTDPINNKNILKVCDTRSDNIIYKHVLNIYHYFKYNGNYFSPKCLDEKIELVEYFKTINTKNYIKDNNPIAKVNRFINTKLEHIRDTINTSFYMFKDNTSEILGGKKRKKPKTVKKYKYVKNKTGKKRKRSEKIKIIKKNKNKMKISQAIIKYL